MERFYIPPTPERVDQAETLFELSQQMINPLSDICRVGGLLDERECGCEVEHYDFIQPLSVKSATVEMLRFRVQRTNGHFYAIAETSLLRDLWSVPDSASESAISAYETTFAMGRLAMQYLQLPEGFPITNLQNYDDLAPAILNVGVHMPSLTTTTSKEDSAFLTDFIWNIGADMPVTIYQNDVELAEFVHQRGGILIDSEEREFVYPEWWSATLLDFATPSNQYRQALLEALHV